MRTAASEGMIACGQAFPAPADRESRKTHVLVLAVLGHALLLVARPARMQFRFRTAGSEWRCRGGFFGSVNTTAPGRLPASRQPTTKSRHQELWQSASIRILSKITCITIPAMRPLPWISYGIVFAVPRVGQVNLCSHTAGEGLRDRRLALPCRMALGSVRRSRLPARPSSAP